MTHSLLSTVAAAAVVAASASGATWEPDGNFRCCAGGGLSAHGDICSKFTAYGVQHTKKYSPEEADKKTPDHGRYLGFTAINTHHRRAIRILDQECVDDYETAEHGWYLFPDPQDNNLQVVTWDKNGCSSYDWEWDLPRMCVGRGTHMPEFRDTIQLDFFNTLVRFQPKCRMATVAVNPLTCMPYFSTVNLTLNLGEPTAPMELPRNFAYQPRPPASGNTLRAAVIRQDAPPSNWRCVEGSCSSLAGYISMVYTNGTAMAPSLDVFGYPSWCKLGRT